MIPTLSPDYLLKHHESTGLYFAGYKLQVPSGKGTLAASL
jgi:hypothetical protein